LTVLDVDRRRQSDDDQDGLGALLDSSEACVIFSGDSVARART
jgi:hypothetical protein